MGRGKYKKALFFSIPRPPSLINLFPLDGLPKMGGGDFELRHWRPPVRPKSILIPDSLHIEPLTTPPPSANGRYTSLAELIPSHPSYASAIKSPSASSIQIRNRLLKHAAYAYLQPAPSSTEARRRRCTLRSAFAAFASCFRWLLTFIR